MAWYVHRRGIRIVRSGDARILFSLDRHGTLTITAWQGDLVMTMGVLDAYRAELGRRVRHRGVQESHRRRRLFAQAGSRAPRDRLQGYNLQRGVPVAATPGEAAAACPPPPRRAEPAPCRRDSAGSWVRRSSLPKEPRASRVLEPAVRNFSRARQDLCPTAPPRPS